MFIFGQDTPHELFSSWFLFNNRRQDYDGIPDRKKIEPYVTDRIADNIVFWNLGYNITGSIFHMLYCVHEAFLKRASTPQTMITGKIR